MQSAFCSGSARAVGTEFLSDSRRLVHKPLFDCSLLALGAMMLLALAPAARADNGVGAWDPPASWPLIAIHTVLTPDGRVLTYGTTNTGQQTGSTIYDIWDPSAGFGSAAHATMANTTGTDIFCSSMLVLPESGNVFIAGGDNFVSGATTNTANNNSNVFTTSTNQLARGNNMSRARWYSSSTTLLNGETYIQGGSSGEDRPEVRDANGAFRLLSGANTSGYAALFPRNFLAPDGRVFGFDASGRMYYVTTTGTGSIAGAGTLPIPVSGSGSAAMFRSGRILQMGGASSAAVVIDINGPTPVVSSTQSMATQRQWVTATVLADGRVLATGGSAVDNQLNNVNNTAAVWDPNGANGGGSWTIGPSGQNARLYHSGALLLPDARVMVVGGGAPGPQNNTNIEMYTPSYLLDPSGAPMARPSMTLAPDTVDVGQSFSIGFSNASSISRVTMVKTGAVTHSVNMDQRFLELGFTTNGSMVDVVGPARATDTPPGYYILFIFNSQGVPAVGKIVRVNVAANPNPTPDTTQVIGGTSGTPFTLACNADEVLAGIYGTSAGTNVNQAGLQCIKVDQNGRWIGTPTNRGITGTAGGAAYTKTCPVNYAISGYRGRSSTVVDQLDFECRALTSLGKITGIGQFLGPVGGTGGTAQGPYNCGTNNPVYALTGRSGSSIVSFGMQCRQATLTAVNAPPNVTNPGNLTGVVGVPVDITIGASDPEGQALTFSATGLPPILSINSGTGRITGTPTTSGAFSVVITVRDSAGNNTTAGFTWTINPANSLVLNPLPPSAPALASTPVTYTASVASGTNVQYSWFFDDGTAQTAYSSSPSITHTFASPGIYYVTVTAIDDLSPAQSQTTAQTIYLPTTANRPTNSSNIAFEPRTGSNSRVWVVNQDNDTVSAFDAVTNAKLAEIPVGTAPRAIARAPDGRMWVTNKLSATISVINTSTLSVAQTVNLPFASQPFGIAFTPTGSFAYVVLEALGRVLKLDASTGAQVASVNVGPNPRHLAVSGDGATLLVARFITPHLPGEETATVQTQNGAVQYGGEVVRVNTGSMTVLGTTVLQHSDKPDLENQGSGIPNYLGAPVISPDGTSAWVPSKQDNIKRGTLRNSLNLNFQSTVRAISSRIDLSTNTEDYASRIDHDNASLASAVAFDAYGVYMFVALETSREVAVVDAHGRWEIFRFSVGRAPQGLALSPDGLKLYVNNFMDRTVGVFDLSHLINQGQTNVPLITTLQAVLTEKLSAQVLKGKQFFYDAQDSRLARDKYLSCASCHNDGGHDGRVWDLTGFGEGLRNTINLRGRAGAQGQGFLHWSANFDEVQDFEGQIRALSGGLGLMQDADFNSGTHSQPLGAPKAGFSADLDALAAYVTSLNTFTSSPLRNNDGTLSVDATAGKQIFANLNCAQCHSGAAFTESGAATLRNIGTIKPSSGMRLGAPLTGIDTPTLRDVWATAPYLHDGSAATLGDAVRAHSGVTVSDTDLSKLVAYLQQIGSDETTAPYPSTQGLVAAYSFNEGTGTAVGDASGTGNAGTTSGTTWNAAGKYGSALVFNGGGAMVTVPDSPSLRLTTAMTLEAWVYPAVNNASWRDVIYKGNDNYFLEGTSSSGGAPGGGGTFFSSPVYGTAPLPVNTWSHIAMTYDKVTLRLYVNGTQVASLAASANIATSANPLQIGGDSIFGQYFNGRIDEVRIYNRALSASEVQTDMNTPVGGGGAGGDTQAPTTPSGLATSVISSTQINLSWTAATDNVAVTNYLVESCAGAGCSNFAQIGTATGTTYNTTGLTASTSYSYRVRATDAAGNLSAYSNVVSASTPAAPDTTAPTAPSNLLASVISSAQINLSWTASTDNVGVTNYLIERCQTAGCSNFAQIGTATGTTFNNTGLTPSTSYSYRVRATDAANNLSAYSNAVSAVTSATPDTTLPTVTITTPTNLATYTVTTTPLVLGGTASDNVGVTQVTWVNDRGGSGTASGTTSWSVNPGITLQSGANVITVTASDAANNTSTDSLTVTFNPPPVDTQPPTAPTALLANATSSSQINLSWTAATDNVGVTGYRIERCQGAGCSNFGQIAAQTGISYSDSGLSANTSYSYRVLAVDAATNLSPYSNTASATTQVIPPATGLVAAYSFNEGTGTAVGDASGTGNAGTTSGTTWNAAGKYGSALVFNGGGAMVTVPDSPSLRLTTAMTLEAWVYPAVNNASWRDVIYKGNDNYFLEGTSSSGGAPGGGGTFFSSPVYGTAPLPVNTWSHIAMTYDKVTLRLYVNGTQVASLAASANIATSANPLQIGGDSIFGQYFNGRIDEVRIYNRALSASEVQTDMNTPVGGGGAGGDTQAPTTPSGLATSVISSTQINLSWTAATDNVAVTNYLVESCAGAGCSNFAQIGTATGTTYNTTGLTASTSYSYRVRATDAAGNLSAYSNVVSASTPAAPDTTAPTAPSNLLASVISSAQINLSWTASTDNVGVTNYLIERCQTAGCSNFAQIGTATGTTFNNTGLTPSTSYSYRVRATDAANNLSAYSNAVSAVTSATPDTTLPTVTITTPTNLATYTVTTTPLVLGGTASDNVGVTQVTWVNDRGGSGTASGTTSWSVNPGITLQSGANVITVTASDAANNTSTDSLTVTFNPPPVDTQPPTAPTALLANATSSSQINLSWTAATDNVGVTGYRIERCQGAGCSNFGQIAAQTGISYSDSGLSANTSYSYRVLAVDAATNLSPYSNTASATTQVIPPATGLVAAYSFNEGTGTAVGDASGTGNAGTTSGTTWNAAGKYGSALVFNGSGALVTINDSPSLRLTTAMTLEAWVYPAVNNASWRDVIYKGNDNYYLEGTSADNGGIPGGGGTFSSSTVYGTVPLPLNTWSHIALTYDKVTLRMYVNGTQVGSLAASANIATSANPLQIGGDSIYGQYFNGRIDDVRVYNRALSASEVQTDMNTPVGP